MVVKLVLQGISGAPHVLYRPTLSTVNKVYNVAGRAAQVILDGECLFGFDTGDWGGLLQMFFADDAFFHTLKHTATDPRDQDTCALEWVGLS